MDVGYVYSAYITLRNGRRLYAKECGLKAFCFPASRDKQDDKRKED